MSAVEAEERGHGPLALESGNAQVEVHPIDALQFQDHVILEDIGRTLWHLHRRLRLLVTRPLHWRGPPTALAV